MNTRIATTIFALLILTVVIGVAARPAGADHRRAVMETSFEPHATQVVRYGVDSMAAAELGVLIVGAAAIGQCFFRPKAGRLLEHKPGGLLGSEPGGFLRPGTRSGDRAGNLTRRARPAPSSTPA